MAAAMYRLLLLLCVGVLQGAYGLKINVTNDGDYAIMHNDGSEWLRSAPAFFVINNVTYSSADKTLTLLGVNETSVLGREEYNIWYQANETLVVASIHRTTGMASAVGFSVTFPQGANGTKALTPDDVICGFPGFSIDPAPARFAYLSYGLATFEAAVGRWQNDSVLLYGGREGSGPFAIFDNSSNAIIMGPSNSFTVTSLWHDVSGSNIYWGIMGGVTQLPAGFQYGVAMIGNSDGVRNGMSKWAMLVRSKIVGSDSEGEQVRTQAIPFKLDLLATLGYWTSPGSAYYASPVSGQTYDTTLFDVRHYSFDNDTLRDPKVDYIHVELDDWWYVKGQDGGVKTWTAPVSVFPDGVAAFANKTQWHVAAACGVWATDNTYDSHNGGQYTFITGDKCALPQDQNFWNSLFATAIDNKIQVFVQKDMLAQYTCMTSGGSDVTTIMTWLSQLNVSATQHNMQVMFSSAVPRLAMESAFNHIMSPVVQVGASHETKNANHWRVGVANIFVDAIGLKPFFGVYQSESNGSVIPMTQLSGELYGLLATLTGGPVVIGDAIGVSDKFLIDKCCNAEGRVLGPLRPAKAIDAQLHNMAWGEGEGATGEVYTTFTGNMLNTQAENNFFTGIILAVGMNSSFDITPKSAGFNFQVSTEGVTLYAPSKIFTWNDPYVLYDFSETKPFTLKNCDMEKYCLYFAAPVVTFRGKDVVIMGDFFKWVPMSSQRIDHIEVTDTKIDVHITGFPDEKVHINFNVGGHVQTIEEYVGPQGGAVVTYEESVPHGGVSKFSCGGFGGGVFGLLLMSLAVLFVGRQ